MKQGKAEENTVDCWWCGRPIIYHPKNEYDNYSFIGLFCATEIAKTNYENSKQSEQHDSRKEKIKRSYGI